MKNATLVDANLMGSHGESNYLKGANMRRAILVGATLRRTDFENAILEDADFCMAIVVQARFHRAKLNGARFGMTVLANVMFNEAIGLGEIYHRYPSSIDSQTIGCALHAIPRNFLEGCGLAEWEVISSGLHDEALSHEKINDIQYKAQVARMGTPVQIGALFISYSHADSPFVDALEGRLRAKGIRVWRDVHRMVAGRLEAQVDNAIRMQDQVLLVLSKGSVNSDWVEHEVRRAREKEKAEQRDVLCPITLDDAWTTAPWPARLMEQVKEYNILDFSKWQDSASLDGAFAKLLAGLAIFYKKADEKM